MNALSSHFLLLIWLIINTLLSAIIVKSIAIIGIMDKPNERSSHTKPTPKGGGIGIVSAFLSGSISLLYLFHQHYSFSNLALFVAVAFISFFSWLDDIKQWSPLIKLIIQFCAALWICIFILPFTLFQSHFLLFILLLIWFVYIINTYNFMDGLNGLAAGVAAICCIFFYFYSHDLNQKILALALLTGLIGFLPFNFPKAEIFMSDVGSQACGLLLANFAIMPLNSNYKANMTSIPSESFLIFFLLFGFIYDVTFTLIRRIISKEPFLQAHRSHLYQMAHRCNISAINITFIQWIFCIWGGSLMYLLPFTSMQNIILAFILLILPQLLWTLFVIYKIKIKNIKKW